MTVKKTSTTLEFITVPETILRNGLIVPSFQVGKYLSSKGADGKVAINAEGSPWVNINFDEAKKAAADSGLTLITEIQWLAIATDICWQDINWTGGKVGEGNLYMGLHKDTVDNAQPGTYESPDPDERRWHQLSSSERVYDFAGNAFSWVFDDIQGNPDGTTDKVAADSPSLTSAPYPSCEKGMGWYPQETRDCPSAACLRGRLGGWLNLRRLGAPQHTFQVLTKRPARMLEYLSRPAVEVRIGLEVLGMCLETKSINPKSQLGKGVLLKGSDINPGGLELWPLVNVWIGVTAENQDAANERIPLLLKTPAAVRWVSVEPLLGPVDLSRHMVREGYYMTRCEHCGWIGSSHFCGTDDDAIICPACCGSICGDEVDGLDWVVVGGESGPHARPMHPDWARNLRDKCADAGVPFMFKQHGEWLATTFSTEEQLEMHHRGIAYLRINGTAHDGNGNDGVDFFGGDEEVALVGKKAAGRLLDGILHDGYPVADHDMS